MKRLVCVLAMLTFSVTVEAQKRPLKPAERYKFHVAKATVFHSQGKYMVAIRHLKKALRIRRTAAVYCDLGVARLKLGLLELRKKSRPKARQSLVLARKHFEACGKAAQPTKKGPGSSKLVRKAKAGVRDVTWLSRAVE